jgi:hypothetical protein
LQEVLLWGSSAEKIPITTLPAKRKYFPVANNPAIQTPYFLLRENPPAAYGGCPPFAKGGFPL